MSSQKRNLEEADPDYADVGDQQAKRQRALEEDAKQAVCRRIQGIVRNEFSKEITNKESELQQVDWRLNEARLMMDRLRACIVANYYGQANRSAASSQGTPNAPPASIHPTVKKYIGKVPRHHILGSSGVPAHHEVKESSTCESKDSNKICNPLTNSVVTPVSQPSPIVTRCTTPVSVAPKLMSSNSATYDDRRARFKIKKKIIVGNVSKYIPVDHREANDMSSHKWMVYVRGPKSDPDISSFVKKVWFFLHHSYKPNDLVEISSPPFHLTRRGWGEFPVRVQLHFVDSRNKTVDIIHHLKLDKTFTGLQTPGAETVLDVELDRDFFDTSIRGNNSSTQQAGARIREPDAERVASKQVTITDSVLSESSQLQVCQKSVSHVKIEHNSLEETGDDCQSSNDQAKSELSDVLNLHVSSVHVSQEEDLNIVDVCAEKKCQIQTSSMQKLQASLSGDTLVSTTSVVEESKLVLTSSAVEESKLFSTSSAVEESKLFSTSSVVEESVPDENKMIVASVINETSPESSQAGDTKILTSVIDESSPAVGANVSTLSFSKDLLQIKQELILEDNCQQKHQVSSTGDNSLSSFSSLQCENRQSDQVFTVITPPTNSKPKTFSLVGANQVYQRQTLIQPNTVFNQTSGLTRSVQVVPSFSPKIDTPQPAPQIQLLPQTQPSAMQKLIVLNAGNVTAHDNTRQVIWPTKQNAPRQVSLLTGMVVNGQSAPSKVRPVTPAHQSFATSLLTQRPTLVNQTLVYKRPTAQVLFMNNSLQQQVIQPNNPGIHLAACQPTSVLTTNKVPEMNGAVRPYPLTLTIVNQASLLPKPVKQISLLKNVTTLPGNVSLIASPILNAGTNNSSVVVNKPNNVVVLESRDSNSHVYPKMSAVGMTKHGKNCQKVALLNPEKKVMTEEEKKRGPYDILKAWKKNPELYERHSAKAKKIILAAKDRIEGEAEEIPELM
ncbi:unnamed protein product [Lymnaea stagnalis]|uniref:YEATS domain-containing protein 2 n=1 Tax=Lymnaea stagnalis TaxID=6523 RepID=A0AAV2IKG4_LYMST